MSYTLHFDEERVVPFLRAGCGLSREGRVMLYTALNTNLREQADTLRADPTQRLAPGSPLFWFGLFLTDPDEGGRIRFFRFVVNDAHAVYGVLHIEYADEG